MSYEYLAHETGYLEKPALHPDQSTNDMDLSRMRTGMLHNFLRGRYGEGGFVTQNSLKILGALVASGYAFYTGKRPIWPYALIGILGGWICQLKST